MNGKNFFLPAISCQRNLRGEFVIYTKTPPNLGAKQKHLCYIKYYDLELKRTNFLVNSYEKDYIATDEIGTVLILKGTILKEQKINLLENKNQVIYSVQLAEPDTWMIEEEYLNFNGIYSIELDKENNLTLILYKDAQPNENYTISRFPIIKI